MVDADKIPNRSTAVDRILDAAVGQTGALLGYVHAQHAGDADRPATGTGTGELRVEMLDKLLKLLPGRSLVGASQESSAACRFLLVGLHG